MMDSIKKYWLLFLLLGIVLGIFFFQQTNIKRYQKDIRDLEEHNEQLVKKNKVYLAKIDSLSNIDVEVVEVIREIKAKEHETIITVDTMSVSDLQEFFAGRYPQ